MLYTICIALVVVACVLLILAVLVQSPKSGMAANFGASNQVMGVRQTTDFLEKFTWVMAVTILIFSLFATVVMDGSTLSGRSSVGNDASNLFKQNSTATTTPAPAEETK